MTQVLLRGRFCETIAAASTKLSMGDSDLFLLGMFSLLDAILQRPLKGILDDLNIGKNLRDALLCAPGEGNGLAMLLQIVKAYEVADWEQVEGALRMIGISAETLSTCFLDSLTWVETIFSADGEKRSEDYLHGANQFHRDLKAT